jgi:hypothetical protein
VTAKLRRLRSHEFHTTAESLGRTHCEAREFGGVVLLLICCFVIPSGRAGAQEPSPPAAPPQSVPQNQSPDNPPPASPSPQNQRPSHQNEQNQAGENKEENPAQAVEDKTKAITVGAAEATEKVGKKALVKARDWESSWITGVYVRKEETRIPLTGTERRRIYLRQTLTTPGAYMKRMFQAGFDQARGVPSQWDDGWSGYAERFASREGQFISANTLAALGNAALNYEVRYDQCRCNGIAPRMRHAIVRNFLTYDHDGNWRPQWALYAGAFAGGAISTAWRPRPQDVWVNGGLAMLGQAGYGALLNVVTEFARDVNRKLGAKDREISRSSGWDLSQ